MNEGICTNDKDKNDTNVDFRNAVTPTHCLAATATPSTTLRRTTSRLIKATTTPTDPSSSKPDAPSTDTKIVTTRWSILGICQFFQLNIWFYNLNLFLTFTAEFSLFSYFRYSWHRKQLFHQFFCQLLDLNRGPLVLAATGIPTEPKPLSLINWMFVFHCCRARNRSSEVQLFCPRLQDTIAAVTCRASGPSCATVTWGTSIAGRATTLRPSSTVTRRRRR